MVARKWSLERWLLTAAGFCLAACLLRNLGVVTPVFPRIWDKAYNGAEYLSIAIVGLKALRSRGTERAAWGMLAIGLFGYAAGDLYYTIVLTGNEQPAVSVARRCRLSEHLPRRLRRTRAAVAGARAAAGLLAVAGRPRLRARQRGTRRRARARRRREQRRVVRRRGDQPRLSARRPRDARVRGRGDRDHRPVRRLHVAHPRPRARRLRAVRHDLPLPGRGRHVPRVHGARHGLARSPTCSIAVARLPPRRSPRHAPPAQRHARHSRRVHADGARSARLRPLRPAARGRAVAGDHHHRRRRAALRADLPREPAHARRERGRGRHRRADGPRQPARAAGRPRARHRRRHAGAARAADAVRPRRLQGLQRLLRPPGRRRAAAPARPQPGEDARRRRHGLSDRRRRVLRARPRPAPAAAPSTR